MRIWRVQNCNGAALEDWLNWLTCQGWTVFTIMTNGSPDANALADNYHQLVVYKSTDS